jgi:seryl-tRNA(Sec) selenium transferase
MSNVTKQVNELLQQYGGYGIAVALAAFITYLLKEHKKERREWISILEKIIEKNDAKEKETNNVIRENTGILSGLKALFEVHIRSSK